MANENKITITTTKIDEIANKTDRELANRYFKRASANQIALDEQYNDLLNNTIDKNSQRKKYNVMFFTGNDNLQYIFDEISKIDAIIDALGYELKLSALLDDINASFRENASALAQANNIKDAEKKAAAIHDIVKQIVEAYLSDIITNKALAAVCEKNNNNNKNVD